TSGWSQRPRYRRCGDRFAEQALRAPAQEVAPVSPRSGPKSAPPAPGPPADHRTQRAHRSRAHGAPWTPRSRSPFVGDATRPPCRHLGERSLTDAADLPNCALQQAYFLETRIRVGVTSTITPSRLRRKAMNSSVSSAAKTPLICRSRNAGEVISMGVAA